MRAADLIREAMRILEGMPVGGVGKDGATQAELDEAAENGEYYASDANYDVAQRAWLKLNEALKGLEK